jgi:GNAT superfamily N-acetyltransferase
MLTANDVTVSQFRRSEEFGYFQCEKNGYREFLQNPEEAEKQFSENLNVTYVFRHQGKAIGFVALAMSSLRRATLPNERKSEKPYGAVPSLLLGHMARDHKYKGQGVGDIMMDYVLEKAHELGKQVGCRFVIVDAEKDKEKLYRDKYGFELVPPSPKDKTSLMFFDLGLRKPDDAT